MKLFSARRAAVGTATLAVVLGAGSWFAMGTSAHVSACRTDPIVRLSNGDQVDMSAIISDDAANVAHIAYTLYVPAGVTVTGETFTGSAFVGKESIAVYASNPVNTYTSSYLVSDSAPNAGALAITSLVAPQTARGIVLGTLTGLANQLITITVTA